MSHPDLLTRWTADQPAFGAWITAPSFTGPNVFLRAGYDYVGIDCQHSFVDEADAARLVNSLQHAPVATVVRVSTLSVPLIGRLLDAGTDVVIVPMINTPEQAQAAVAAARYTPRGDRSFGPLRPSMGLDPHTLEDRADIFVMIETAQAVQNLEAICATPGLAGVYVGPADLALGLGEDQIAMPPVARVDAVVRDIARAAQRAGVVAGIHAGRGPSGATYAEAGFRLITLGAESQLLYAAASADLAAARGAASGRDSSLY